MKYAITVTSGLLPRNRRRPKEDSNQELENDINSSATNLQGQLLNNYFYFYKTIVHNRYTRTVDEVCSANKCYSKSTRCCYKNIRLDI